MIYPLITYPDGTEIVCSQLKSDNTVDLTVETPMYGGFRRAVFTIPSCTWKSIFGYTEAEIADFQDKFEQIVDVVMEIARDGIGD